MKKVIVNDVLSIYSQTQSCINFLFNEWRKIEGNENKIRLDFPKPSDEMVEKAKHKFPAITPLYEGELLEFRDFIAINDGQGETDLIALVLKEDGFIAEIAAHRIQFVKEPENYMQRLVVEERELSLKINKLKNFISSNPEQVKNILIDQLSVMEDYHNILVKRVSNP